MSFVTDADIRPFSRLVL